MQATFREILYMTATIYGEARGESHQGKVAVGWVIRNRVESPAWWGRNIIQVCVKPFQFSCWNENDPNVEAVKAIARQDRTFMDKQLVQDCLRAALEALHGTHDPMQGADHYHAIGLMPPWADDDKFIGAIGHHKFYKIGSI